MRYHFIQKGSRSDPLAHSRGRDHYKDAAPLGLKHGMLLISKAPTSPERASVPVPMKSLGHQCRKSNRWLGRPRNSRSAMKYTECANQLAHAFGCSASLAFRSLISAF